jgi:hypothetical protein
MALDERASTLSANLALERELLDVLNCLSAAGVAAVVLKGIPLARRLGADLSQRRIRDNDLLVRREHVERAVDALTASGYQRHRRLDLASQLRRGFQYPLFRSTPTGTKVVEIHWNAFPPELFAAPSAPQWQHTEPFALSSGSVLVFDAALTVLQLCSHFVQSQLAEPRILVQLGVAWDHLGPTIDHAMLVALARELGVSAALAYCLRCASELRLTTHPPPEIASSRAKVLRQFLHAEELLQTRRRPDHTRSALGLILANPRAYVRWLAWQVAPPIDVLASVYDEPINSRLYARYLTRPVRGLSRALSQISAPHET